MAEARNFNGTIPDPAVGQSAHSGSPGMHASPRAPPSPSDLALEAIAADARQSPANLQLLAQHDRGRVVPGAPSGLLSVTNHLARARAAIRRPGRSGRSTRCLSDLGYLSP